MTTPRPVAPLNKPEQFRGKPTRLRWLHEGATIACSLLARHSADAVLRGGLPFDWAALAHGYQVKVHDLGAPVSPFLSWCSISMSASGAVMSASSNAPCRPSLSLLSSTSRSTSR